MLWLVLKCCHLYVKGLVLDSWNYLTHEGSSVSFIFQDWRHECLHTGYSCIYLNLSLAIFLVPIHLIYCQIKNFSIKFLCCIGNAIIWGLSFYSGGSHAKFRLDNICVAVGLWTLNMRRAHPSLPRNVLVLLNMLLYKMARGMGQRNGTVLAVHVWWHVLPGHEPSSLPRGQVLHAEVPCSSSTDSWDGVAKAEPTTYFLMEIRIWEAEMDQLNLWCTYNSTYKCGIAGKYILPCIRKNKESQSVKREGWRWSR